MGYLGGQALTIYRLSLLCAIKVISSADVNKSNLVDTALSRDIVFLGLEVSSDLLCIRENKTKILLDMASFQLV